MSQDEKLFEEAFDLIIRLQTEPNHPQLRAQIDVWRAQGADYEQVWREAMHVHRLSGDLLSLPAATPVPSPILTRRRFLCTSAALLGVGGIAALSVPPLWREMQADNRTRTAQLQQVELEDGSAVSLGPDSAIRYRFSPDERRVELLSGMAFIEVAQDDNRVFRASSGQLQVTTLDGAFDLSLDAALLNIAVARGSAEVLVAGKGFPVSPQLVRGDWLSLDTRSGIIEHGHHPTQQPGLWREQTLIVESEPLSAVVARIARWQPGKVIVANNQLGQQRISGVYNLTHPLEALQAAVQPRGGKVHCWSRWLTVIANS